MLPHSQRRLPSLCVVQQYARSAVLRQRQATRPALQAAIKALFASGRTPDDKKTWQENFMNRFGSNLLNEADPLQLIPGYSDLITVLKKGEWHLKW